MMTGKAESPGCHTILRTTLLETGYQVIRHVRQTTTQQRFHDVHRNVSLRQFIIKVFGMIVTGSMTPIHIVQLNHGKVPLYVHIHYIVESCHIPMERPSEVADTTGFTFLQKKIQQAIVNETFLECFDTLTATNGVKEIVIDIIYLKILQRIMVHLYRTFEIRDAWIRHLGSDEELVARMAFQSDTHCSFRLTLKIYRSRIEKVYSTLDGIVHQFIHLFLINNVFTILIFLHRPTHTSITEKRNFVTCIRVRTVSHFAFRFTSRTFYRPFLLGLVIR